MESEWQIVLCLFVTRSHLCSAQFLKARLNLARFLDFYKHSWSTLEHNHHLYFLMTTTYALLAKLDIIIVLSQPNFHFTGGNITVNVNLILSSSSASNKITTTLSMSSQLLLKKIIIITTLI